MGRLTLTQFAERVGVHVSTISRAVAAGRVDVGPDGLVDEAGAAAQFDQNRRRRRRRGRNVEPGLQAMADGPSAVASSGAFFDAKTRREVAEASMAELKEAEQRGELVRRAVVERELSTVIVALRESLEVLADRLSASMAAESDAAVCRAMLRTEHRHAMAGLVARLSASASE